MGNVKIVFSEGRKEHFQGGDHREQASNRLFISFCCWFLENLTPSTQLSLVCMYSEADSSEWLASYVNSGCKQFSLVVDPHSIQYYILQLQRAWEEEEEGIVVMDYEHVPRLPCVAACSCAASAATADAAPPHTTHYITCACIPQWGQISCVFVLNFI